MATQIYLGNPPEHIRQWIIDNYVKPEVDMTKVPLHFIAEEPNATIKYDGYWTGAYEISYTGKDDSWISYNKGTTITLPNIGDKVYFRAFEEGNYTCEGGHFSMQKNIAAMGNILSLRDRNFTDIYDVPENCFSMLFEGCTSLTKAPALPATYLASGCYNSMFQGCTALTQAPELPATTLSEGCYYCMFQGCTSLTQAPELPAETLASFCYGNMFSNCTSLNQVFLPNLEKETVAAEIVELQGTFSSAANNIEVTCKDGILIINETT